MRCFFPVPSSCQWNRSEEVQEPLLELRWKTSCKSTSAKKRWSISGFPRTGAGDYQPPGTSWCWSLGWTSRILSVRNSLGGLCEMQTWRKTVCFKWLHLLLHRNSVQERLLAIYQPFQPTEYVRKTDFHNCGMWNQSGEHGSVPSPEMNCLLERVPALQPQLDLFKYREWNVWTRSPEWEQGHLSEGVRAVYSITDHILWLHHRTISHFKLKERWKHLLTSEEHPSIRSALELVHSSTISRGSAATSNSHKRDESFN